MADEVEKKPGWLSKIFWGAVKVATIGLVAAVAWQMFLDPLFFQVIHDAFNIKGQAWMAMIQDNFNWIPRHAGLLKEPGLLSGLMDWVLGDRIAKMTPPGMDTFQQAIPDFIDPLAPVLSF